MAARDAWAQMTHMEGPEAQVRGRLAAAFRMEPAKLQPASLWTFFERSVPLGTQRGLAYVPRRSVRFGRLVARMAVNLEDVAVDRG